MISFLRPLVLLIALLTALPALAEVRIKDIADVEGVRENQLIGYGLVVGLNNTGDKLDNAVFTRESLIGMLERLGVNTRDQVAKLSTKNIAAVMVTADLPGVCPQRQPDRCRGLRSRRCHQPDRRHACWSRRCWPRMARSTPSLRVRSPRAPSPRGVLLPR